MAAPAQLLEQRVVAEVANVDARLQGLVVAVGPALRRVDGARRWAGGLKRDCAGGFLRAEGRATRAHRRLLRSRGHRGGLIAGERALVLTVQDLAEQTSRAEALRGVGRKLAAAVGTMLAVGHLRAPGGFS